MNRIENNISYYKIKYDTIIFSDQRFDKIRNEILPIFRLIDHIQSINQNFYEKLQDCYHKAQAAKYSLTLIEAEIKSVAIIEELKQHSSMVGMCPKTEFQNDVLIYELESFLFQIQSNLDILIQALKYLYPYLEKEKGADRESFEGKRGMAGAETIAKFKQNNDLYIASLFEKEVAEWIQEMNEMRNTITHRSGLKGLSCFVLDRANNILSNPKMPSGKKVDEYCQYVYSRLMNLYKKVFEKFILKKEK
jgi:hypothetical protein